MSRVRIKLVRSVVLARGGGYVPDGLGFEAHRKLTSLRLLGITILSPSLERAPNFQLSFPHISVERPLAPIATRSTLHYRKAESH